MDGALRLLARREYSQFELGQKLLAKGHDENQVRVVLGQLVEQGYLSDDRFAEAFIRTRRAKGIGPLRIRAEMGERRVDEGAMQDGLAHQHDWIETAREVRRKRFGSDLPTDYAERARQTRFLQYRGFSADQIKAAFRWEDEE